MFHPPGRVDLGGSHPHPMDCGTPRDRSLDDRNRDTVRRQGRQLCPGHGIDGAAQADHRGDGRFWTRWSPTSRSKSSGQLDSMLRLEDRESPNFTDADYQLAAYAAALRVMTKYRSIEDIDVAPPARPSTGRRGSQPHRGDHRGSGAHCERLPWFPPAFPHHLWRLLGPEEKLYLKGLEIESHGGLPRRASIRSSHAGFGLRDLTGFMLQTGKANQARLKTASEFQRREIGESPIRHEGLVRHALYAVWRTVESGDVSGSLTWLRTELSDYWPQREALTSVLRYPRQYRDRPLARRCRRRTCGSRRRPRTTTYSCRS